MTYYRCFCGSTDAFGSIAPAKCRACGYCNTFLAGPGEVPMTPSEHDFTLVSVDDVVHCRGCGVDEVEYLKSISSAQGWPIAVLSGGN